MTKHYILISVVTLLISACGGGDSKVTIKSPTIEPIEISGVAMTEVNEESEYLFIPTFNESGAGVVEFSILNQPSWAAFDVSTGALTGIPDDADVGTDNSITITATNSLGSVSLAPFSITVHPINDVPELADQTKTDLLFDSTVSFTLTATDVDSAASSYVYNVQSQASHGTVVITDHETSAFEYQPSSVSGIGGDSFTLELSDGIDTSNTVTVSLGFNDVTPPMISLSPNNGASSVAIDSSFVITSDDPLNTSSLTYNSSAGACSGTVQISKDSFINCIAINSAVASNLNRTITITADTNLDASSTYEFKVTTGVNNLLGGSLATDVNNGFNTASNGLIISEIGESGKIHDMRWFELYNGTSSAIDVSTYSFKSRSVAISNLVVNEGGSFSYSSSSPSTATFPLPSVNIQPGQYLIVRSKHFTNSNPSSDRIVYVYAADAGDGTYPYWDSDGFIDLIKNSDSTTQDFVTFGASYTATTNTEWAGTFATALPSVADQYGHSLGRDGSNTDTGTEDDWSVFDFATMGGVNDVTCTADADADGIPDCSEVSGSTFAGLPLYDWGARTGQKDIFIEVDYMVSGGDEGIVPREEALQKVVDVFWDQGIAVHFDVGDLYDAASGIDPADFDLGGGEEVPFVDAMTFSTATSLYDYKLDYMDYSRMQIFHYLIFANTQDGSQGSSGLAEINGNDLIVSLGEWNLDSLNTANSNTLINFQASTIMHELGHNLGLYHGGSDDGNNYEPNYISVMNYLYQLTGLPTIGSNEGDRFNYHTPDMSGVDFFGSAQNATCYSGLSNDKKTDTFNIDFSHGNGINLSVANLNETLGLGQPSTDGVDFNCDGDKTDTAVNLGSGVTWTDHDDWGSINLDFQHYYNGDNNGVLQDSRKLTSDDVILMPNKVKNDRAPVAREFRPPAIFFERLREDMKIK